MATVSIITVVLNSSKTIADCLTSVRKQQNVHIEHIVVDGGSQDGTLEVVASHNHVAQVIHGPDKGIYDAMNKGIAAARGDIIGFLNADDFYSDGNVVAAVTAAISGRGNDTCYGDLQYIADNEEPRVVRYWKAGRYRGPRQFYNGWMPPHPTFFAAKEVYERYGGYDLSLGTAADYELMLRMLVKHRVSAEYIPRVLVTMRTGGVSNATIGNRMAAHGMDRRAWQVNGLRPYPWTLMMKPLRKAGQWLCRPSAEAHR
jgi:glycosyltransferase